MARNGSVVGEQRPSNVCFLDGRAQIGHKKRSNDAVARRTLRCATARQHILLASLRDESSPALTSKSSPSESSSDLVSDSDPTSI